MDTNTKRLLTNAIEILALNQTMILEVRKERTFTPSERIAYCQGAKFAVKELFDKLDEFAREEQKEVANIDFTTNKKSKQN